MDNKIYLYDNNFIGLLNLISFLITNKIKPQNIKNLDYQPNLLDELINLNITIDKEIFKYIIKTSNKDILRILYYIYLSKYDNKELVIYYFYLNMLKYHANVIHMRNLKCVSLGLKLAHQVKDEVHKLKGFLRFQELSNKILYAKAYLNNDVLYLLSCHFKNRLPLEYWIIKDENRKMYSVYDKHNFYIVSEENFNLSTEKLSNNEKNMQDLWKEFYRTIGISERKNDKCRMNFMPKKYWKYIIEMEQDI